MKAAQSFSLNTNARAIFSVTNILCTYIKMHKTWLILLITPCCHQVYLRQALILLHFSPLLSVTQQRTFPPKTGAGKCTSTNRFSDKDSILFCHLPIACQGLAIKSILCTHEQEHCKDLIQIYRKISKQHPNHYQTDVK